MADEEIRFRISADDQASGTVEQVARSQAELAAATRQGGTDAAASASAERSRAAAIVDLRDQLEQLIRQQVEAEDAIRAGTLAEQDAAQAMAQRQGEITRISQELGREQRIRDRMAASIREHSRATGQAADAQEDLGAATAQANDQMERAGNRTGVLGGFFDSLRGRVSAAVAGLIGVGGLLQALRAIQQELETNARLTREFAEAQLNLQFLDVSFDPSQRQFIGELSKLSGRRPTEIAQAYGEAKSRFPERSDAEIRDIMRQAAESSITTNAPMESIVNALSTLMQEGATDAQQAQNILFEAGIQAGTSDPAKLSALFARVVGIARSQGKLDLGQAAGVVSAATGLGLDPAEATTQLRNIILTLQGEGTKEQQDAMAAAGITPGQEDFLTALQRLSQGVQSGAIRETQLQGIFGRENVPTASKLADPAFLGPFLQKVQAVAQAERKAGDTVVEYINREFSDDRVQRLNLAIKQAEAAVELSRAQDQKAQELALAVAGIEQAMRERGASPAAITVARILASLSGAAGAHPDAVISLSLLLTNPGSAKEVNALIQETQDRYNMRAGNFDLPPDASMQESADRPTSGGGTTNITNVNIAANYEFQPGQMPGVTGRTRRRDR